MSVALVRPTDDLAETANREHEQAIGAATAMVRHALNAGDALLAAKAQTAPGQWTRWLASRFVASPETANVYMALAHHRDVILVGAALALHGRRSPRRIAARSHGRCGAKSATARRRRWAGRWPRRTSVSMVCNVPQALERAVRARAGAEGLTTSARPTPSRGEELR